MKDTVVNVLTKEVIEVEVSVEEQNKREIDAVRTRDEANKPIPLSLEEQIAFLKERDSRMQDDISSIIEGLTGGV